MKDKRKMKIIKFLTPKILAVCVALIFLGCAAVSYRYEVHLVDGGGSHHLITADTEDEAQNFIDEQEDSHGVMEILKLKNK